MGRDGRRFPPRQAGEAADTRVLVIKLGAFGDFIHAFHGFAAIRAHHPEARIELLTTAPFEAMALGSPWFDGVHVDTRPPWWDVRALRRLRGILRGHDRVYDLQTSGRSGRYFRLAGRPPWSGIARGSAFPHRNPARDGMHTLERQREQLLAAGLTAFPEPDRAWLVARGSRHGVAAPYALLIPGDSKGEGSPKRWPVAGYGTVARMLTGRGVTPVVVGGPNEAGLAAAIGRACPGAVDLTGRTTMFDIAALGAGAVVVVGNDTGPLQLACAMGGPTVALFSGAYAWTQVAPRGPNGEWATMLREADLADLGADRVLAAVAALLDGAALDGVALGGARG